VPATGDIGCKTFGIAPIVSDMHNALKAFERARGEDTPTDTQSADAETTSGTNDAQKLLQ
jgi:hypothetical protein